MLALHRSINVRWGAHILAKTAQIQISLEFLGKVWGSIKWTQFEFWNYMSIPNKADQTLIWKCVWKNLNLHALNLQFRHLCHLVVFSPIGSIRMTDDNRYDCIKINFHRLIIPFYIANGMPNVKCAEFRKINLHLVWSGYTWQREHWIHDVWCTCKFNMFHIVPCWKWWFPSTFSHLEY